MKQTFRPGAILFVLLFFISSWEASARVLRQGHDHREQLRVNEPTRELMGVENCEEGDDECSERRVVSEAHLDYVYTERHGRP